MLLIRRKILYKRSVTHDLWLQMFMAKNEQTIKKETVSTLSLKVVLSVFISGKGCYL